MKRNAKDYTLISLKGVAMGAADVVPGVSGGTIAFITGVYEELIDSIKSINLTSIKELKNGIPTFWKAINGNFLLALGTGILLSVFTLANVLNKLLTEQPILIWSFFFGLIVASAIFVAKKIKKWNIAIIIGLVAGTIIAYFITVISPAETPEAMWFVFISGAIAICAMILPGISGSFILLLLGKLQFMYKAISELDILSLVVFASGAGIGLLSFSNLLSWLLKKYHDFTIAILAGFMIGSLNKVWPWKETVATFFDRHGVEKPLEQVNVLPHQYAEITQANPQLLYAVLLAIFGFIIIVLFEKFAVSTEKNRIG